MTTKQALQIPYEPSHFDDFRAGPVLLSWKWCTYPEELPRPSVEGELPPIMFLIDAFLRHNLYPLQHWTQRRGVLLEALFKMLLCQILEHLGYPSEPQLERKRICRELFTLDKWNNMTAYRVDQPERPQPAARRASPRHIPEGITVAAPAIPRAPPVAPASSQPSTSAEPRMAIPISEYRELCVHWRPSQHLRAALLKRWQPFEHAKSRCWPLRLNTLPS
ncbi:hypothetical protein CK203_095003 [Vitis vinifera]|uniref:Uncharacterized protein n=1 Tax=Vitis vinifera TaxID=29760 RepID=A0A438ED53_VITVI|nr:hypothetical protein CK203_095003 [Vitis vinifera]